MKDKHSELHSVVKWTNYENEDRRRIVVDIPDERWDEFQKTWKEFSEKRILTNKP